MFQQQQQHPNLDEPTILHDATSRRWANKTLADLFDTDGLAETAEAMQAEDDKEAAQHGNSKCFVTRDPTANGQLGPRRLRDPFNPHDFSFAVRGRGRGRGRGSEPVSQYRAAFLRPAGNQLRRRYCTSEYMYLLYRSQIRTVKNNIRAIGDLMYSNLQDVMITLSNIQRVVALRLANEPINGPDEQANRNQFEAWWSQDNIVLTEAAFRDLWEQRTIQEWKSFWTTTDSVLQRIETWIVRWQTRLRQAAERQDRKQQLRERSDVEATAEKIDQERRDIEQSIQAARYATDRAKQSADERTAQLAQLQANLSTLQQQMAMFKLQHELWQLLTIWWTKEHNSIDGIQQAKTDDDRLREPLLAQKRDNERRLQTMQDAKEQAETALTAAQHAKDDILQQLEELDSSAEAPSAEAREIQHRIDTLQQSIDALRKNDQLHNPFHFPVSQDDLRTWNEWMDPASRASVVETDVQRDARHRIISRLLDREQTWYAQRTVESWFSIPLEVMKNQLLWNSRVETYQWRKAPLLSWSASPSSSSSSSPSSPLSPPASSLSSPAFVTGVSAAESSSSVRTSNLIPSNFVAFRRQYTTWQKHLKTSAGEWKQDPSDKKNLWMKVAKRTWRQWFDFSVVTRLNKQSNRHQLDAAQLASNKRTQQPRVRKAGTNTTDDDSNDESNDDSDDEEDDDDDEEDGSDSEHKTESVDVVGNATGPSVVARTHTVQIHAFFKSVLRSNPETSRTANARDIRLREWRQAMSFTAKSMTNAYVPDENTHEKKSERIHKAQQAANRQMGTKLKANRPSWTRDDAISPPWFVAPKPWTFSPHFVKLKDKSAALEDEANADGLIEKTSSATLALRAQDNQEADKTKKRGDEQPTTQLYRIAKYVAGPGKQQILRRIRPLIYPFVLGGKLGEGADSLVMQATHLWLGSCNFAAALQFQQTRGESIDARMMRMTTIMTRFRTSDRVTQVLMQYYPARLEPTVSKTWMQRYTPAPFIPWTETVYEKKVTFVLVPSKVDGWITSARSDAAPLVDVEAKKSAPVSKGTTTVVREQTDVGIVIMSRFTTTALGLFKSQFEEWSGRPRTHTHAYDDHALAPYIQASHHKRQTLEHWLNKYTDRTYPAPGNRTEDDRHMLRMLPIIITEEQLQKVMRLLAFMDACGFRHGDLKLDNIAYDAVGDEFRIMDISRSAFDEDIPEWARQPHHHGSLLDGYVRWSNIGMTSRTAERALGTSKEPVAVMLETRRLLNRIHFLMALSTEYVVFIARDDRSRQFDVADARADKVELQPRLPLPTHLERLPCLQWVNRATFERIVHPNFLTWEQWRTFGRSAVPHKFVWNGHAVKNDVSMNETIVFDHMCRQALIDRLFPEVVFPIVDDQLVYLPSPAMSTSQRTSQHTFPALANAGAERQTALPGDIHSSM